MLALHILSMLFFGARPALDIAASPDADALRRRIVRHFDFDERKIGNFERVPMHWEPIVRPGFPRYLEPVFDEQVGHAAAPSFRLAFEGGSIGSAYQGKDIPVCPGCDYRVEAWLRTADLVHAKAFIRAFFLDEALKEIPDTQRQSEPLCS